MRLKLKQYKYCLTLFFTFFAILYNGFSQGKINTPATECLKNVTTFTYTPPSGTTLSSANWLFGDGSSSSLNSPQYIYKNTGTFKIVITANLSNGTTVKDSTTIIVVPLPIAKFRFHSTTDTCFNNNNLCFVDSSRPGSSNQTIVTRLAVWGDGAFNNTSNPSHGSSICHKYSQIDKYLIKFEITDNFGCKASYTRQITLLEQTNASYGFTNSFKDCNSKNICFKNQSTGKNISKAKYYWDITNQPRDTNPYFNSLKCVTYNSSMTGSLKLLAVDANGCRDSIQLNFSINIDPLPSKLYLKDSVLCYSWSKLDTASVTPHQRDKISWLLDGNDMNTNPSTTLSFTAKGFGILPGKHVLSMRTIRGSCTTVLSRNLVVKGPIAAMKIYDNNQCFSNRLVTFVNDSRYADTTISKAKWVITDPNGLKCTTDRKKGTNLGSNCNISTDWYHSHKFKTPPNSFKVSFTIKDTISGCTDSIVQYVEMKDCSPLIILDSIDLCQGELFDYDPPDKNPKFVTLDSGKTWVPFPVKPNSKLNGTLDVGFIFETILPEYADHRSDDTMMKRKDTLIYYDTVYKKAYLRIHSINSDSAYFKLYGQCRPFHASVHFTNGKFYAGQKLEVNWGNGQKTEIYFVKDSTLDSLTYQYNGTSVNATVKVTTSNQKDCKRSISFVASRGKIFTINNLLPYYCKPTNLCFTPKVYDLEKNAYWNDTKIKQYVGIQFQDTPYVNNGIPYCHFFGSPGYNKYKIYINDEFGCSDTLTDSLFVQNLKADVKQSSRTIYCSELKQFFDSSTFIKYPNESLIEYNWDFGSGSFTNPVINPFKSLNTSASEIFVTHTVKTVFGCVDTIRFKLNIIGSHPYFRIVDTIACNSLEAIFRNLSKNCSGYIWEFGDPDGNILPMPTKDDVTFKYLKPGRYQIRLNGYDSIYNPSTQSTYFCNAVFPDPLFQKDSIRAVVVLPQLGSGIMSPDTVCPGVDIEFISKSDPMYNYDIWNFEDTTFDRPSGDTVRYSWDQTGKHVVRLVPKYLNSSYDICSDSTEKTIYVLDVKADFEINPLSVLPTISFTNKSTPLNSNMFWDFGEGTNQNSNFSTEIHPSHSYGYDTGTYNVCLIASTNFGCADTTCKPIKNDYLVDIMLFNVFTPGEIDGKNDRYDVLITGEASYHLRIYDRWGVLVYEGNEDSDNSTDINWNGRLFNKGAVCPSGTYYYIFDYSLNITPEKFETVNGTITLIR